MWFLMPGGFYGIWYVFWCGYSIVYVLSHFTH